MATTVFTTWSDLYEQMLDQLASQNFTQQQFRVGDRNFEFKKTEDIIKELQFVKTQKEDEEREDASDTGYGVIYQANGGRGAA